MTSRRVNPFRPLLRKSRSDHRLDLRFVLQATVIPADRDFHQTSSGGRSVIAGDGHIVVDGTLAPFDFSLGTTSVGDGEFAFSTGHSGEILVSFKLHKLSSDIVSDHLIPRLGQGALAHGEDAVDEEKSDQEDRKPDKDFQKKTDAGNFCLT